MIFPFNSFCFFFALQNISSSSRVTVKCQSGSLWHNCSFARLATLLVNQLTSHISSTDTIPFSVRDFNKFIQQDLIVSVDPNVSLSLIEVICTLLLIPHFFRSGHHYFGLSSADNFSWSNCGQWILGLISVLNFVQFLLVLRDMAKRSIS